jgi:hypothetical protein
MNVILRGIDFPIEVNDATSKGYVDSLINGVSWLQPVLAAATVNQLLAFEDDTITLDDVEISIQGSRILLLNQNTSSDNGIYNFDKMNKTLTRSADFPEEQEMANKAVFVSSGTTYADNALTVTSNGSIGIPGIKVQWTTFANIIPVTVSGISPIQVTQSKLNFSISLNNDITAASITNTDIDSPLLLTGVDGVSIDSGRGSINVNNNNIEYVASPRSSQDAANKGYVDTYMTGGNSILVINGNINLADTISVGGNNNQSGKLTMNTSEGLSQMVFSAEATNDMKAIAVGPNNSATFFVTATGDATSAHPNSGRSIRELRIVTFKGKATNPPIIKNDMVQKCLLISWKISYGSVQRAERCAQVAKIKGCF